MRLEKKGEPIWVLYWCPPQDRLAQARKKSRFFWILSEKSSHRRCCQQYTESAEPQCQLNQSLINPLDWSDQLPYLSWNSGVFFRNSSPGWTSKRTWKVLNRPLGKLRFTVHHWPQITGINIVILRLLEHVEASQPRLFRRVFCFENSMIYWLLLQNYWSSGLLQKLIFWNFSFLIFIAPRKQDPIQKFGNPHDSGGHFLESVDLN